MKGTFFTCFYCYFSLYAKYGTGPAMESMPEYGSVPSVPGLMNAGMILTHLREQFNECQWTGHFLHVSTLISVPTGDIVSDRKILSLPKYDSVPSVPGLMTTGMILTQLREQFNQCKWMGHFLHVSTVISVRTWNMVLDRQCHPCPNIVVYNLCLFWWLSARF